MDIPTRRKVDAKAQRELGAIAKTLGDDLTPERRDELVAAAEKVTALRSLDAPKSMLNHRIRQLKRQGYSNVAIGAVLDIHESTVRRRLKMPLTPIEVLLDKLLFDLEDCREDIVNHFVDVPEFEEVFGEGFGEKYLIQVHTNARRVDINTKLRRTRFTLEFVVSLKDIEPSV